MFGRMFEEIDGLTRDEVNEALGRELVPEFLDQVRALRHLFNSDADGKHYSGTILRTDNLDKPIRMFGEGWSEEDHARFKAASSKYDIGYRPNGDYKPVTAFLDIHLDMMDDEGWDKHVANIGIDFRDRGNVRVFNLFLENIGIADPANKQEALAALRVAGQYMDMIDRGERLNPHEFRQNLIDAGLKATGPVKQLFADLWDNRPTRMTETQIRQQDDKVKRMARRRRSPGK